MDEIRCLIRKKPIPAETRIDALARSIADLKADMLFPGVEKRKARDHADRPSTKRQRQYFC